MFVYVTLVYLFTGAGHCMVCSSKYNATDLKSLSPEDHVQAKAFAKLLDTSKPVKADIGAATESADVPATTPTQPSQRMDGDADVGKQSEDITKWEKEEMAKFYAQVRSHCKRVCGSCDSWMTL